MIKNYSRRYTKKKRELNLFNLLGNKTDKFFYDAVNIEEGKGTPKKNSFDGICLRFSHPRNNDGKHANNAAMYIYLCCIREESIIRSSIRPSFALPSRTHSPPFQSPLALLDPFPQVIQPCKPVGRVTPPVPTTTVGHLLARSLRRHNIRPRAIKFIRVSSHALSHQYRNILQTY